MNKPLDSAGMKEFGFCPEPIEIKVGPMTIRPFQDHDTIVGRVFASDRIHKDWIYAPPEGVGHAGPGRVHALPYSSRVFDLPKTHTIEHATAKDEEHLEFHVWALSFFLGVRLTTTEAGYLDATPVKRGTLVDFLLRENSLERAVELADNFWMANIGQRSNAKLFIAAVHALFLGQYPQSLQFERFIYLYAAIDACFKLGKTLKQSTTNLPHSCRIEWMCSQFGLTLPDWAKKTLNGNVEVSTVRNPTLHEALFMGEPLGFALHGPGVPVNLTHEMHALVCRLLVALIGGDASYIGSRVDSMQRQGLKLR